jgi:hypothetical protein
MDMEIIDLGLHRGESAPDVPGSSVDSAIVIN